MERPIEEYIPQRKPFIFVDKIISHTQTKICTSFVVVESNPMVLNGVMQEGGLVENMAQSAAALEGANAILSEREVKIGYIGSVKKLKVHQRPYVNDLLETSVEIVNNALGVNIAECCIKVSGKCVAECILNIFLKED